ncbi:uncharacterized protein LOC123322894 isoform X2 [Coccinella septempunctata]|uniref:uncharacterized protein LOC123322894 isoform X2 n=1 Tax=Coccinella septempunctata TaxID=41139 RepID=UPI001D08EBE2|nr:uncharacterized protein LOC123322894 isoform X2 [Coccinella septempunctata]
MYYDFGTNASYQFIICWDLITGENAVCYLYTRLKFGWNELDFSIFFLTHSFIDIIGSSFSIVILSKIFKWEDSAIGVLALCTVIIAEVIYAFAPNFKYFYAGIIADIFFTIPPIALRSLMAKIVPESELGRSNSLLGLSEALVPLIFGPIYSTVYKNTMKIFPGSFYFVSIFMYSISTLLFIYLHRQSPNDRNNVEEKVKLRNSCEYKNKIQRIISEEAERIEDSA